MYYVESHRPSPLGDARCSQRLSSAVSAVLPAISEEFAGSSDCEQSGGSDELIHPGSSIPRRVRRVHGVMATIFASSQKDW
jgi:hypothetical protein